MNKVDYAIGDFDSFENPEQIISKKKIIKFNSEKDYTDTLGAYIEINKIYKNITENHFFCITGPREDHFLSTIYSFAKITKNREHIQLHNGSEILTYLKPGKHIFQNINQLFSFFPLMEIKNLSFCGTKYDFKKKNLSLTGQGVSNVFLKSNSIIKFSKGLAIISIHY